MMRQTNAVWLLFIFGTLALNLLKASCPDVDSSWSIVWFIKTLWLRKYMLIKYCWAILVPVLAFVGFVLFNGGIVLGMNIRKLRLSLIAKFYQTTIYARG